MPRGVDAAETDTLSLVVVGTSYGVVLEKRNTFLKMLPPSSLEHVFPRGGNQ